MSLLPDDDALRKLAERTAQNASGMDEANRAEVILATLYYVRRETQEAAARICERHLADHPNALRRAGALDCAAAIREGAK